MRVPVPALFALLLGTQIAVPARMDIIQMDQFVLNVTLHAQHVPVHQQIAPHAVRTIIWRIVDATSALRDAQAAVLP